MPEQTTSRAMATRDRYAQVRVDYQNRTAEIEAQTAKRQEAAAKEQAELKERLAAKVAENKKAKEEATAEEDEADNKHEDPWGRQSREVDPGARFSRFGGEEDEAPAPQAAAPAPAPPPPVPAEPPAPPPAEPEPAPEPVQEISQSRFAGGDDDDFDQGSFLRS